MKVWKGFLSLLCLLSIAVLGVVLFEQSGVPATPDVVWEARGISTPRIQSELTEVKYRRMVEKALYEKYGDTVELVNFEKLDSVTVLFGSRLHKAYYRATLRFNSDGYLVKNALSGETAFVTKERVAEYPYPDFVKQAEVSAGQVMEEEGQLVFEKRESGWVFTGTVL